jgi:methanol--5-hydroxybenzimidazolylcobamide Co-methyltransferase
MHTFRTLAIDNPDDLIFGMAPKPVRLTPHIVAGGGETIPELNYILPHNTEVSDRTIDDVVALYRTMAQGALQRALELGIEKLVIEIELVFELTLNPGWGEAVIRATREVMNEYEAQGVHSALRTTVADIRDRVRPPRNRTSAETELVLETFERCAPYSDILSIESTGGKEVCDGAILQCDPGSMLFALGVLASNDMEFLWKKIVGVAEKHGKVAGGDAACGFANTAMQLARKRMVPGVFAAVVRAVGAARSLVAVECGAKGPDKDCAYEGPYLKAIAGIPIAMEGKAAACAHSSLIGNVAMCACDLWSNESVPYAQLFGGFTPEVMLEQLWYDCKLMNTSLKKGQALVLRDLLAESDIHSSAEALVLAPASCIRIARAIVEADGYAARAHAAAREALAIVEEALAAGELRVPELELPWLDMIKAGLDEFASQDDGKLVDHYAARGGAEFVPSEYGL